MFFEAPPTLAKIREMQTITDHFFHDCDRFSNPHSLLGMYNEEYSPEVEACFDAFKRLDHGQNQELVQAELKTLLTMETYNREPLYQLLFSSSRRDIVDFATSPSEENTPSCGIN